MALQITNISIGTLEQNNEQFTLWMQNGLEVAQREKLCCRNLQSKGKRCTYVFAGTERIKESGTSYGEYGL